MVFFYDLDLWCGRNSVLDFLTPQISEIAIRFIYIFSTPVVHRAALRAILDVALLKGYCA